MEAQRQWPGGFGAAWAEAPDVQALASIPDGDRRNGESLDSALVQALTGREELLRSRAATVLAERKIRGQILRCNIQRTEVAPKALASTTPYNETSAGCPRRTRRRAKVSHCTSLTGFALTQSRPGVGGMHPAIGGAGATGAG
jgi:hypothetical protein